MKRLNDGDDGYVESIPFPSIGQLRNWKKKTPGHISYGELEYHRVSAMINEELKFKEDWIDEKKAFSYGAKLGVGSDNDPLIFCFTSKHLLKNISRYHGHYACFHIDGTYKLLKNRFPVIAYGRSDTNGQLHLISIAITSHETTELYKHFYK